MLIESIPKEPLSFHVIPFDNPKMQYTLQAKSLEQKRYWCLEIKHLILENYNAVIPAKAKELVMMLGKSKEEGETYSLRQEFGSGCPKLGIVNFLGVHYSKGDHNIFNLQP